ncbi:unnamed protein product [Brachionus calyciflorus]|uniref:Uncharacterized protein n=1 Tax=Brachionus calyciflorus TaxID=104777 RepID=A0A814GS91_9BILA|nr:unnamed protein product [Brachionus calyciflorus]
MREIQSNHNVTCLKLMKSGLLVSGCENGVIDKLDYLDGKKILELKGHSGAIKCFEESFDGSLISGSEDSTIRIWKESGERVIVLTGHSKSVSSLKMVEEKILASGSFDAAIIIWDLEKYVKLKTFKDDSSFVLDLNLVHDYLVSGSSDGTIRFWDTDTESCFEKIENKNNVSHLHSGLKIEVNENNDLFCCFSQGTVKIFKILSI